MKQEWKRKNPPPDPDEIHPLVAVGKLPRRDRKALAREVYHLEEGPWRKRLKSLAPLTTLTPVGAVPFTLMAALMFGSVLVVPWWAMDWFGERFGDTDGAKLGGFVAGMAGVLVFFFALSGLFKLSELLLRRNPPPRPHPDHVEKAIRQSGTASFAELADRLDAVVADLPSIDVLVEDLRTGSWDERLVAWKGLSAHGPEVAPALLRLVDEPDPPEPAWIAAMLEPIARRVAERIADRPGEQVCPDCCLRATTRAVTLPESEEGRETTFDVLHCRGCQRIDGFLEHPGPIVAVLDADPVEEGLADGELRVDAIRRPGLADLDRVRILRSTDAEVEVIAVRLGNDEDPVRRGREIVCEVASSASLDPNTERILERTFARIERV